MSTGAARSLWRFRGYGRPHLRVLGLGIGLRIGEMAADIAYAVVDPRISYA